MCGIIGFIGLNPSNKFIINGLLQLQNRGYDSAGICTLSINNEFLIYKYASKTNVNAMNLLKEKEYNNDSIGIGHTDGQLMEQKLISILTSYGYE